MSKTVQGIELDQSNSRNYLSDGSILSLNFYTQVQIVRSFDAKTKVINIISVKSEIDGILAIYSDGKEIGKLFVGEGIENISCKFEYVNQFSIYFRPDDKFEDETFDYNLVKVMVV